MLKRLRRKFIIITMSLVGLVLVGVLGVNLYSTAKVMNTSLQESMSRALERGTALRPSIGSSSNAPDEDDNGPGYGDRSLVYVVEVSSEGVVLESNSDAVTIDSSTLTNVITDALASDGDSGTLDDVSLAWQKKTTSTGIRIVIADASTIKSTIASQVTSSLITILVAMGILFVITWFLAKWAFEPVEKSWEQQKRFVADASHELKTPLAVILANMQILTKDLSKFPAKDARWITSTQEEAEHMKGLVADLLDLAKTDENRVGDKGGAFQAVDVDLTSMVDELALQFDAVAYEDGCEIESDIADDVHVTGDPISLERLTKSLIENACKYAEKGTKIQVSLAKDGQRARFSVINQGTPIDPEDLPHVFERFYRSDKARSRETGGYGLGLAIAKGIVDAHHGQISVKSSAEEGTCFSYVI